MVIVPDFAASFTTVVRACMVAKERGETVGCVVDGWGRGFIAKPTDDPHKIYHDIFPEYGPHPERAPYRL